MTAGSTFNFTTNKFVLFHRYLLYTNYYKSKYSGGPAMKILGILGSPRLNGRCAKLLNSALVGAQSTGAEVETFKLIRRNVKYCLGCGNCYTKNPELTIGNCPIKDETQSMLKEYLTYDGYFYASPAYDMFTTALMKTFLERKIAFTYKSPDTTSHVTIPGPRPGITQNFKKKASFIVTANVTDELEEVMGEPCYEAFEAHLLFEEIDTYEKLFCGGVERITPEAFQKKRDSAYQMGINIVQEIKKARSCSK